MRARQVPPESHKLKELGSSPRPATIAPFRPLVGHYLIGGYMRLTKLEKQVILSALCYVVEVPSLEWLEAHTKREIAAAERAIVKLSGS
jgi:hypothetical protein